MNPSAKNSVLLVCVKYGADRETEQYLGSLRGLRGEEQLRVIVVENTVGRSWECAPDRNTTIVSAPKNLGYFGGARYGLTAYLAQNELPEWIIVSNVDLAIADQNFLDRLATLDSPEDVGVVAPSIRSAMTGVDQNPFFRLRPSALRMHMYKWLYRSWLALNVYEGLGWVYQKLRGLRGQRRPEWSPAGSREFIYAPHGSFLIFSKKYFERGGDLQFPEFLFGEEIYVAENASRLGLKVIHEPSLQVVHQEHHSTKLFKSREVAAYVAGSAAFCADTYFPLLSKN